MLVRPMTRLGSASTAAQVPGHEKRHIPEAAQLSVQGSSLK